MKLYTNYDEADYKKFFIYCAVVLLFLMGSSFYFMTDLFIPFMYASQEYINFMGENGSLKDFGTMYLNSDLKSNLDDESFILFMIFQLSGAMLVPMFMFFFFIFVVLTSMQIIGEKLKVYPNKPFKISRKKIE